MLAETLASVLLLSVGLVAVIAVVIIPAASTSPSDPGLASMMRIVSVAAVCAALAVMMTVANTADPTPVNGAIGDAMTTLAPSMTWAALRAANNRPRIEIPLGIGAAACTATAIVSLTCPPAVTTDVVAFDVIVLCVLVFAESRRGRIRTEAGAALMGIASLAFAVYYALQTAGRFILGADSPAYQPYFGVGTERALGGAVLLAVTLGVILLRRSLSPQRRIGASADGVEFLARAVLDKGQTLTAWTVELPEVLLIRIAFGANVALRMSEAAASAIYDAIPSAMVASSPRGDILVALEVRKTGTEATARLIHKLYLERSPHPDEFDAAEAVISYSPVRTPAELATALEALGRRPRIFALTRGDEFSPVLDVGMVS